MHREAASPPGSGWPFPGARRHADIILLLLIFALVFTIHLFTAARTVTFSDSGDFLMGIKTVGNIHGPGYPLYLMTVKLFSWLFPFGTLAFRASVYSGLFATLTGCLIYWILVRMTRSRAGAAVGALAYSFSYTFWYQSVIAETYSLNAFFICLLIVLALRWERQLEEGEGAAADNTICAFALVYGLAFTNHFSIIFLLPAFLFLALDTDWRRTLAPRNLFRAAVFFIIGTLPYIYEPTAAFRGPAYNYGDPATLKAWFRHITVYYQRGGLFGYPYRYFPLRFWRYFGTLTTEFPYFWWLAALGFPASFRGRSKKHALFLALLFLLALLPVMTYLQLEAVLRAHFYYTSYLVVSLWVGMGAAYLIGLVKRSAARVDISVERSLLAAALAILVLCPLLAFAVHYRKVDKSGYTYAREMAENMLGTAAPDSMIVVDDDNVIFPCLYLQVVNGIRNDVRVISAIAAGVPGFSGGDLLAKTPPGYKPTPDGNKYIELIERNYLRMPVYTTVPGFVKFDWNMVQLGFVSRVYPAGAATESDRAGPWTLKAASEGSYKDSDARGAVLLPQALRASAAFSKRDYAEAGRIYARIIPEFQRGMYVPTLYSCGTFSELYELWGQCTNAAKRYRETVRNLRRAYFVDPDFYSLSLARAYMMLDRFDAAVNELDKYLTFLPENTTAMMDLAEVYLRTDRFEKALIELDKVIHLSPASARAHLLKGRALYLLGSVDEAKKEFNKAYELDPGGTYGRSALENLKLYIK